MTDEEYQRLLSALAGKHLRGLHANRQRGPVLPEESLRVRLEEISSLARLVNAAAADRRDDDELHHLLARRLREDSPIENATDAMDAVGLLDALDDAPAVVFGEFRRQVVPAEDVEMLKRAGFTDDEIEILLALAVEYAHRLGAEPYFVPPTNYHEVRRATAVLEDAARVLREATDRLSAPPEAPKKKRKLFNGIGKLLGGAVMGVGNALVATGTILAPNPATGSIAIASGAGAIASLMAGIGDLRGE